MSSAYVRNQIISFLNTNAPTETVIDVSSQYSTMDDMVIAAGITTNDPWLGLDFIGGEEIPITLASDNAQGKYRETGTIYFHVVDVAKLGVSGSILTRAETLRDLLRGRRIGQMIIESVSPPNFGGGATLSFEGGYMAAAFFVSFERDFEL